uniref:Ribonuclease H1 N-terminal domain-containing protein n=1 Tax=Mycena chlorophos TaxID=658473 RepID=A0ABQ0KWU6_MYCCL|nr:predicted protein [Mycena chlorophos]
MAGGISCSLSSSVVAFVDGPLVVAGAAVKQFTGAVYKAYVNIAEAETAFEYARQRGYTTTSPQRGLLLPVDQIPKSALQQDGTIDAARLTPCATDEEWYVVYKGVNPGLYPTYLECALNTCGVRLAVHQAYNTLADALVSFRAALRRPGEVQECRVPK